MGNCRIKVTKRSEECIGIAIHRLRFAECRNNSMFLLCLFVLLFVILVRNRFVFEMEHRKQHTEEVARRSTKTEIVSFSIDALVEMNEPPPEHAIVPWQKTEDPSGFTNASIFGSCRKFSFLVRDFISYLSCAKTIKLLDWSRALLWLKKPHPLSGKEVWKYHRIINSTRLFISFSYLKVIQWLQSNTNIDARLQLELLFAWAKQSIIGRKIGWFSVLTFGRVPNRISCVINDDENKKTVLIRFEHGLWALQGSECGCRAI